MMNARLLACAAVLAAVLVHAPVYAPVYAQEFLPPEDMAAHAIDTHPLTARGWSTVHAAEAEAQKLEIGEYEYTVSTSHAGRDIDQSGQYHEWDAGVSRAIRLPGKADLDVQTGDLGIQAQKAGLDGTRHQVGVMLLESWLSWLEAETLAAIDRQEAENWQTEQAIMARRVAARDAAQLDLDELGAVQARAAGNAAVSAGRAKEARSALKRQFPDLAVPDAAPAITAPELPGRPFADWFDIIRSRNDGLRAAELEAKRLDTIASRKAKDQWADPTVGVKYFSERGGAETGVGITLSMPIGGGYRSAVTDASKAEASAGWATVYNARQEADRLADQVVIRAEAGYQNWQHAATALAASDEVRKKSRRSFEVGHQSLSDFLLAARLYYESERAEVQTRAAAQMYLTRLKLDAKEIWIK
jgi:outer membrane protein TolC